MPWMMVLRTVAGWVWSAVRRKPETPAADRIPSLTIGAILMSNNTPETSSWAGNYSRRRRLVHDELLSFIQGDDITRFLLSRALDGLQLPELEALYDELYTFVVGNTPMRPTRKTTLRDEKE